MTPHRAPVDTAMLREGCRNVTTIRVRPGYVVRYAGQAFELATRHGLTRFAECLGADHGLAAGQIERIVDVLASQDENVRDELARMAIVWATAETGAAVPSHLVLSGYAGHGELAASDGHLALSAIAALAMALPRAARQVEDVEVTGASIEGQIFAVDVWRRAFPNLRRLGAFDAIASSATEELDPAMILGHASNQNATA